MKKLKFQKNTSKRQKCKKQLGKTRKNVCKSKDRRKSCVKRDLIRLGESEKQEKRSLQKKGQSLKLRKLRWIRS